VSFKRAAQFELAVRPQNRIRIDGQVDCKLPHGGQLISGSERSRRNAASHLVDDLPVDGNFRCASPV